MNSSLLRWGFLTEVIGHVGAHDEALRRRRTDMGSALLPSLSQTKTYGTVDRVNWQMIRSAHDAPV
jgi:hypothetical protein